MTHTSVFLVLVEATYKVVKHLKDIRIVQLERDKLIKPLFVRSTCDFIASWEARR